MAIFHENLKRHEDAHTYAMTASRSPRVEKLYKILQEIDWDRIQMVEDLIINGEEK